MARILVTGANRGIGLQLASHFLARGDEVVAVVRNPTAASELQQCPGAKSKLTLLAADVTDENALAAAAAKLGNKPLDVVICNAGVMSSRGGLADHGHDAAEWQRIMLINVGGVFFTARAFLPQLKQAKGKLAILSSMMGSSAMASGNVYAYRASKAAAANLGANFAVELKPASIAVGIYHPGWVSSDMGGASAPVTPDASAKGLVDRIGKLSMKTTGVFEDYLGKPYAF